MKKSSLCVGLVCVDVVAVSEKFPVEDTDQRIPDISYRRGGNASNSSSVLAQLGMKSEFLGTLANSIQLDFVFGDFSKHSVSIEQCPILPDCDFPTSVVIISTANGTRTILHHPKNLPELGIQHFCNLDLNNYAWIHFEGRSSNVNNIKQMIKYVRLHSECMKISIEIEKARPVLDELFPLADVILVSKEYAHFSGFQTMNEAVEGFLKMVKPGTIIVCAWGSEGAAAGQGDMVVSQSPFSPAQIVDTLGAGDTFNAAFIYSQANQWDWKKGLEFACQVAGSKIGQKGFLGIRRFKHSIESQFKSQYQRR